MRLRGRGMMRLILSRCDILAFLLLEEECKVVGENIND